MTCTEEQINSLIQSINCSKPGYCPPCVSVLETALEALITSNTVRIAALEAEILQDSDTLDFPSIAADDEDELTITVTGAAVGDSVSLAPPSAIEAGLVWCGYVSAVDTVTVRVRNTTAGAIDPASATWGATVLKI
jgi:hypothetical protein